MCLRDFLRRKRDRRGLLFSRRRRWNRQRLPHQCLEYKEATAVRRRCLCARRCRRGSPRRREFLRALVRPRAWAWAPLRVLELQDRQIGERDWLSLWNPETESRKRNAKFK